MPKLQTYPKLSTKLAPATDAIVIVLTASRELDGERVPITDAQKDSAMSAAKAVLQCVGADVDANSTSFLIPGAAFESDRDANLVVETSIETQDVEEA